MVTLSPHDALLLYTVVYVSSHFTELRPPQPALKALTVIKVDWKLPLLAIYEEDASSHVLLLL